MMFASTAEILRSFRFLALAIYTFSPAAQAADQIAATVDGIFRPLLQQHDVPGIAVAVTAEGRSQVFTYGIAAKDSRAPVTRDTLFELGSVSKTFTATLAAYAQAQGRLSWDDHPGKYLPSLRGSAVDATSLLQLGTYTAGGLSLQFPDAVKTDAQMIAWFRQWRPAFAPGAQRQYSNPSIGLFGHLAGLALGGDYAALLESRLLPGFGLAQSHIRVPAAAMTRYAWGYNSAGKPVRVSPGPFDAEAYGMKSTAADMIRFVELNIRPDMLEPLLRQAVEGTQVGYVEVDGMVQGLGWERVVWPIALDRLLAANDLNRQPQAAVALDPPQRPAGPALFNKTGSTNGFSAYVAFVPARRVGVVMLANRNLPIPVRITAAHAVLRALAP
jgi:beta-lactamase class C